MHKRRLRKGQIILYGYSWLKGSQAVGGIDTLINESCKDKDTLVLIQHMSGDDRLIKILENQQVITTPVVRNGKIATLGYQPDAWKEWV